VEGHDFSRANRGMRGVWLQPPEFRFSRLKNDTISFPPVYPREWKPLSGKAAAARVANLTGFSCARIYSIRCTHRNAPTYNSKFVRWIKSRVMRPRLLCITNEVTNALDNFCDSVGSVVAGTRELVHVGRIIHILLVVAVVVLLIQLFSGRRPAL
jgi:hypothetical protein